MFICSVYFSTFIDQHLSHLLVAIENSLVQRRPAFWDRIIFVLIAFDLRFRSVFVFILGIPTFIVIDISNHVSGYHCLERILAATLSLHIVFIRPHIDQNLRQAIMANMSGQSQRR